MQNKNRLILFLLSLPISLLAKEVWEGGHYQATCKPQYEMAEYAISQLPQRTYKAILDIGCGSGDFTLELSKCAEYVLGVDYSASMIEIAKKSYGHHKKLDFEVGDIRALTNVQKTFDLITAFHPIQWIPNTDQHKAFEQMANHLNPKGICLVLVGDRFNILYNPLMDTVKKEKWAKHIPAGIEPWNWQSITSISNSFEQASLRPLKVLVWYKKYHLKNKQAFFDFMANWYYGAAHFSYLSEEKQEELFYEVLEYFLTLIGYKGEGPVEFESPFVVGIAEKLS